MLYTAVRQFHEFTIYIYIYTMYTYLIKRKTYWIKNAICTKQFVQDFGYLRGGVGALPKIAFRITLCCIMSEHSSCIICAYVFFLCALICFIVLVCLFVLLFDFSFCLDVLYYLNIWLRFIILLYSVCLF